MIASSSNLKEASVVLVLLTCMVFVWQHVGALEPELAESSVSRPYLSSSSFSSFPAAFRARIDRSNVRKMRHRIWARIGQLAGTAFELFTRVYNRTYEPADVDIRLDLFLNRFKIVRRWNQDYSSGKVSFSMKLNHLADRSDAELDRLHGLRELDDLKLASPLKDRATLSSAVYKLRGAPESKNWRDSPCLPEVRDQGPCGSCYAFATVDRFGMNYCLEMGPEWTFPRLFRSPQQIVDCGSRDPRFGSYMFGCDGGVVKGVVAYLQDKKKLAPEHKYPYQAAQASYCKTNEGYPLKKFDRKMPEYIEYHSEEEMRQHVGIYGPLVAGIHASRAFQMYNGGIFDSTCGNKRSNHAVLVVGYGRAQGKDYWLIKNSYGTDWGEKGYMRMVRGKGLCQMGSSGRSLIPSPSAPLVTTTTTPKPTTPSYSKWYRVFTDTIFFH